jgi:Sulfotransferase domain
MPEPPDHDDAGLMPNLFIVGVARGGTTSLWSYLDQHPDVFMAAVKEPYYFSDHYKSDPFPKDRDAYLSLFAAGRDARWRGEASTAYFWDPSSAARIEQASPSARILISLRNPADRAYSEYLKKVRSGEEQRGLLPAIREEIALGPQHGGRSAFLASGFYIESLERYLEGFGANVHVLFFEELAADPRGEVRRIFEFLEVDPNVAEEIEVTIENRSYVPRRGARRILGSRARAALPDRVKSTLDRLLLRSSQPVLPPEARRLLDEVYSGEREQLRSILRREPSW